MIYDPLIPVSSHFKSRIFIRQAPLMETRCDTLQIITFKYVDDSSNNNSNKILR